MKRVRDFYNGPAQITKQTKITSWEDLDRELAILVKVAYPRLYRLDYDVSQSIQALLKILGEYNISISDANQGAVVEFINDHLEEHSTPRTKPFVFKYKIPECFVESAILDWYASKPPTPHTISGLPAIPPVYARYPGNFNPVDYAYRYLDTADIIIHDVEHNYENAMMHLPMCADTVHQYYFNTSASKRIPSLHFHKTKDIHKVVERGYADALNQYGDRAFPLPLPLSLYDSPRLFEIFVKTVSIIMGSEIDKDTQRIWFDDIRSGARTLNAGKYSHLEILTLFSPHLGEDFFPILPSGMMIEYDYINAKGIKATRVKDMVKRLPTDLKPKYCIGLSGEIDENGSFEWRTANQLYENGGVTLKSVERSSHHDIVWVHIVVRSMYTHLAIGIPNLLPQTTVYARFNSEHHFFGIYHPYGMFNSSEIIQMSFDRVVGILANWNKHKTIGSVKWYASDNLRTAIQEGYHCQLMVTTLGVLQTR